MGQKKSMGKLECVKLKIRMKTRKYLGINETKHNVPKQNLMDATKEYLRGKFIALHPYVLKKKISTKKPNFIHQ